MQYDFVHGLRDGRPKHPIWIAHLLDLGTIHGRNRQLLATVLGCNDAPRVELLLLLCGLRAFGPTLATHEASVELAILGDLQLAIISGVILDLKQPLFAKILQL